MNAATSYKERPALAIKIKLPSSISAASKHAYKNALRMDNSLGSVNVPRRFLQSGNVSLVNLGNMVACMLPVDCHL